MLWEILSLAAVTAFVAIVTLGHALVLQALWPVRARSRPAGRGRGARRVGGLA
jgi:hypothetical protein